MSRLEESRRESGIKNWIKRTILAGKWGYARGLLIRMSLALPLLLAGCSEKQEEEVVDYEGMVMNEEKCEWTSSPDQDGKHIAGELFPEPQEILLQEFPDTASKLDGATIR